MNRPHLHESEWVSEREREREREREKEGETIVNNKNKTLREHDILSQQLRSCHQCRWEIAAIMYSISRESPCRSDRTPSWHRPPWASVLSAQKKKKNVYDAAWPKIKRIFQTNTQQPTAGKNPWKNPVTNGTDSPSRSETLRFIGIIIHSAKSPSLTWDWLCDKQH